MLLGISSTAKELLTKKNIQMKQKLEHAFKAGRISENTTFEEWYKTFEEGKAEELYIKWQKMAVERGVLLNEILEISKTFTKVIIDDSLDTNVQNDLFEDDTESCEVFTNCGE